MGLVNDVRHTSRNNSIRRKAATLPSPDPTIYLTAIWGGYNSSYVQTIVKGTMKALKILATLTFDPGLFYWTKGLEGHLNKKIREAEKEEEFRKSMRF